MAEYSFTGLSFRESALQGVWDRHSNGKQDHGEHYVVQACVKQIKAFCTEFGMTPSSRARLMLPSEKTADDPLENLIQ